MNNTYSFKAFVKRLLGLYRPFGRQFTVVFIFVLAGGLVTATYPFFYGQLVNMLSTQRYTLFFWFAGAWFAMRGVNTLIVMFREHYELHKIDFRFPEFIGRMSLEHMFNFSLGQHVSQHSGIKRSILKDGEDSIHELGKLLIYDIIPIILGTVIPVTILLWISWPVGLLVLGGLVTYLTFLVKINKPFVPKYIRFRKRAQESSRVTSDVHSNRELVIIEGQEKKAVSMVADERRAVSDIGISLWQWHHRGFYAGQGIILLFNAAAVFLTGWFAMNGQIGFGLFVSLVSWIGQALGELGRVSRIQREAVRHYGSIVRYFQTLDIEPEVRVPESPLLLASYAADISFNDVVFSYPRRSVPLYKAGMLNKSGDDEEKHVVSGPEENGQAKLPAVNGVSFTVQAGKRHAFVGKSGACKSTLVYLLVRAWDPQGGSITIRDVNLKALDFRELRRHIGIVPQQVELFDTTLRDNILFGIDDPSKVSEEELRRACTIARVAEFADKLEHGLDTQIGEKGVKLSGGQRQRIGIARALVKKPDILVFDEATSNLDAENERLVHDAIEEASRGVTTIFIAHRLATVVNADTIFVFEEGKLVGSGKHAELLQQNKVYQNLVQNQLISNRSIE
ncbi:MAG: ABC transporter ATP-binding protein [Patescibacteria group bacterium]